MDPIEIRLFTPRGRVSVIYKIDCPDEDVAMARLSAIERNVHGRFEIWCGEDLLAYSRRHVGMLGVSEID